MATAHMLPIGFGKTPRAALDSYISSLKFLYNTEYRSVIRDGNEYFYAIIASRKRYITWTYRNDNWCCGHGKKEPTPWALGYCDLCLKFREKTHKHNLIMI